MKIATAYVPEATGTAMITKEKLNQLSEYILKVMSLGILTSITMEANSSIIDELVACAKESKLVVIDHNVSTDD